MRNRVWTCRVPLPPLTLNKTRPVSSHLGQGSIQDVHLGQVMFRLHWCLALLLLRPSCSPAGQIHPCCLRTNKPIHGRIPQTNWGGNTNVGEGSGEWVSGSAILFHAQHSQPLSQSPRFHRLVTGEQLGGGAEDMLEQGQEWEDETQVMAPGWIRWTLPKGLMTRQRTGTHLEDSRNPQRPDVLCSNPQAVLHAIVG